MKYIKYLISALLSAIMLISACYTPDSVADGPPEITVKGANPLKTPIYFPFVDDTVLVHEYWGLDTMWFEHNVDTALLGKYKVRYFAKTLKGMASEAERDVWTVVQPKSMADVWQVQAVSDKEEPLSYSDSLIQRSNNLVISNLNNIEGAEVSLKLASDLQDSVYIEAQMLSDSIWSVAGNGVINEKATLMELHYILFSEEDTTTYHAVYERDL